MKNICFIITSKLKELIKHLPVSLFFILISLLLKAQEISVLGPNNPANPTVTRTQIKADFASFFFVAENRILMARPSFEYGFNSERSLAYIRVPVLSTYFTGNFQGFERQVGLGDISFGYTYLPFMDRSGRSTVHAAALNLDISTPTGNSQLGLGVGVWQYTPSLTLEIRPSSFFAFYPRASYTFSGGNTTGQNNPGGGTVPDPGDPNKDRFSTLILDAHTVVELMDWNGWFGINPIFLRDFEADYSIFAIGADIGKKTSDTFGLSLDITTFIGGQPRLNAQVMAKMNFYLE